MTTTTAQFDLFRSTYRWVDTTGEAHVGVVHHVSLDDLVRHVDSAYSATSNVLLEARWRATRGWVRLSR